MSDLDRSMHRTLWVLVAHSLFIEGLHMTKNTASEARSQWKLAHRLYNLNKSQSHGNNQQTAELSMVRQGNTLLILIIMEQHIVYINADKQQS